MSYRIQRSESLAQNVRRIVAEQIDGAVADLMGGQADLHEAIHQARKRFKKIRGVLRLIRPVLGDTYADENAFYRDLGRDLARVRDAQAMVETLDALQKVYADQLQPPVYETARTELMRLRDRAVTEVGDLDTRVAELVGALKTGRERLKDWPAPKKGFRAVRGGLQLTYQRGRTAMAVAYDDPTGPNFHEWRKRVKYHWYHGRLLAGIWPDLMKGHRRSLKKLSDLLGDDHNLVVFREFILSTPDAFGPEEDVRGLLGLAEQHQQVLRDQARAIGARVYAEKPKAFTQRWGAYWNAWR
jgi:CHAD domain-containing protein